MTIPVWESMPSDGRRRIAGWLDEATDGEDGLLARLRRWRDRDGGTPCAWTVEFLSARRLTEADAERLLERVARRRGEWVDRLGRPVDWSIALSDLGVPEGTDDPVVVDRDTLDALSVVDPPGRSDTANSLLTVIELELRRARRNRCPVSLLAVEPVGRPGADPGADRPLPTWAHDRLRGCDRAFLVDETLAILLPATDRLGALAVAGRLRRVAVESGRAAPAAGVATSPDDADEAESLWRASRQAFDRAREGTADLVAHRADRRAGLRYPFSASTRVQLETDDGVAVEVVPLDLGRGGARVGVGAPAPTVGAEVVLQLEAGSGPGAPPARRVVGRVARGTTPEDPAAVGIEFRAPLSDAALAEHAAFLIEPGGGA